MRNHLLGVGIILSAGSIAAIALTIKDTFAQYPILAALAGRRSQGLFQAVSAFILQPAAHAPLMALALAAIYAFVATGLIYYFFEKTQSPEILFFALFTASFAAEGMRIVLPLAAAMDLPQAYVVMAARVMLFGRQIGLFAFFMAGVYAAGLEFQKHGNLVILIAAISLTIATGIPMDGLTWDSAMTVIPGYNTMFSLVDAGIAFITSLSFIISAYTRGSREFVDTAVGSFLVFIGRDGLIHADSWIVIPLALGVLVAGTWLIATRLHRYYLWL